MNHLFLTTWGERFAALYLAAFLFLFLFAPLLHFLPAWGALMLSVVASSALGVAAVGRFKRASRAPLPARCLTDAQ